MHTLTNFNQTDYTKTARYDGANFDKYLNNSNSYNDNSFNHGLNNYNNYKSNCESDNKEASCASTSTTVTPVFQLPNVQEQKTNIIYILR